MNQCIDWRGLTHNFNDLRRSIGSTAVFNRPTDQSNQPPNKKPRIVDKSLEVSISLDKFPRINPEFDRLDDPARFLIDAVQLKVFYAAVNSMARFSDTILLFPSREGLTVKACNLTRTAAGSFTFCLDFFGAIHTFEFPKDTPCCRVFIKPFLSVLKKVEQNRHLDTVIIDMDPNSETMVMRVSLRNGILKYYRLPTTDVLANTVPKVIKREGAYNTITMLARQLHEALEIAGKDASDIGFWGSNNDVIFHTVFQPSYSVDTKVRKGAIRVSDCININIRKMVNFSFSAKEIRALANFADKYNATISLYFRTAKTPLFVVLDIPGLCDAVFTVSTSAINEGDTSSIIKQMIAEINIDVEAATQATNQNSIVSSTQQVSATQTPRTPRVESIEISQSNELIQAVVNQLPQSYWRRAVAIGPVEEVEFD